MNLLHANSKNKELIPTCPNPRYDCPFYGFHMVFGMLMDSEGNQCALITDSYSPCQMEISEQTPNWSECRFNTEESRSAIAKYGDKVRVSAKEFWPEDAKSWKGLSFTEWLTYVRNPETPRP